VAILLALGVGINFWLLRWQRRTSQQVVATQQAVSNVSDEMAKLRQGIMEFTQQISLVNQKPVPAARFI
jgi:phage shock protein A